jgi:TonB family protein
MVFGSIGALLACGFFLFRLSGCISSDEIALWEYDKLPELVKYKPFDFPISGRFMREEEKVRLRIHIDREGNVDDVVMLEDLMDVIYNETVIKTVKDWKYSPAIRENQPVPVWIVQTVKVRFSDLKKVALSEILVTTKPLADSLWGLLNKSEDFSTLAKSFSTSTSAADGGFLGEVDVRLLEPQVFNAVSKLGVGEFTPPIATQRGFVIYERMRGIR